VSVGFSTYVTSLRMSPYGKSEHVEWMVVKQPLLAHSTYVELFLSKYVVLSLSNLVIPFASIYDDSQGFAQLFFGLAICDRQEYKRKSF
jgi:hypothetical protein